MQDKDILKTQARLLVSALKSYGIELPHGKALDVVSRFCGSKDWNALAARLKNSAPGKASMPVAEILERIETLVYSAGQALDSRPRKRLRSAFVDNSDDEAYAYEKQIDGVQNEALPLLRSLIAGERVASKHPRLLVLPSGDGPSHGLHALLPAGLDEQRVISELQSWLDEMRKRDAASEFEESYVDTDVEAKLAELGCIVLPTPVTGPTWDW